MHENWIEQHIQQDSYKYLIQRSYLQLLRYNKTANGMEPAKKH